MDILGNSAQFGNLFLAGSPDHRMPDEGGAQVHSQTELGLVRAANYFGIN